MPFKCHKCDQLLTDQDISENKCPVCGMILHSNQTSIMTRIATTTGQDETLQPFLPEKSNDSTTFSSTEEEYYKNADYIPLHINCRKFSKEISSSPDSKSCIDYTIKETIGEGGMGKIIKATQEAIGRSVAIKLARKENTGRTERKKKLCNEAAITGRLQHPNIVPVYDLGITEEKNLFYAMKLVEGRPWSEVIEAKSLQENIEILLSVCNGISFAHSQGIIHRDIKPDNIMLGLFGEVLISDWGLAAGILEDSFAPKVSYEEAIAGTPSYMAPEMALGYEDKINEKSDIYLLGAILYEIITGEPPHKGRNVSLCLFNAGNNVIEEPWIKSELIKTALKAMATRQEDRYQTVKEFQKAIKTHYQSVEISTRAKKLFQQGKKEQRYSLIIKAIYQFQDAIEKWEDNNDARKNLAVAVDYLTSYAEDKTNKEFAEKLLSVIKD